MDKDLIIGAADLYTKDNVRNWILSIKQSGFDGEIILLCYRVDQAVIDFAKSQNVACYGANSDSMGNIIQHNANGRNTQSHQMRFYHIWHLLNTLPRKYRFVIATDVRDVIFQKNPSTWLDSHTQFDLFAPSENIIYYNEPWGKDNLLRGFGPAVYERMHLLPIYNVGTIAGKYEVFKELCLILYSMGQGRYIPNDQSSFNVLLQMLDYNFVYKMTHNVDWACQCGTTLDPEKPQLRQHLMFPPPSFDNVTGNVYTPNGELYVMVHQYDRVPGLRDIINQRYAHE